MKFVSVTMVKNDEDIIEPFVRHHAAIVDELIVLDHNSTDRTGIILAKLQQEGVNLHVLWQRKPVFNQSEVSRELIRMAVRELGADVVVFVDCDEFLVQRGAIPIREVIESALAHSDVIYVPWLTYVATESDEGALSVLDRITRRLEKERVDVYKVCLSSRIVDDQLVVRPGNHSVARIDDAPLAETFDCEGLGLAHFPVRSAGQARRKYIVGWLSNVARGLAPAFDWAPYYYLTKRGGLDGEAVAALAANYNEPDRASDWSLCFDPVRSVVASSHSLKHTPSAPTLNELDVSLDMAEELARYVGRLQLGGPLDDKSNCIDSRYMRDVFGPALTAGEDDKGVVSTRELFDLWQLTIAHAGVGIVCIGDIHPSFRSLLESARSESAAQAEEKAAVPLKAGGLLVVGHLSNTEMLESMPRLTDSGWRGRIVLVGAFGDLQDKAWSWVQALLAHRPRAWEAAVVGRFVCVNTLPAGE